MKKIIVKILRSITTLLICAVVLVAFLLAGVRVFGMQVYTVLSPSMEPEYHTGATIYVKPVDPATLEVGDDITFRISGSSTATHRIIEVIPNESDPSKPSFRTQGIANEMADGSPVTADSIVGSPVFTVPYLGYVAAYIQQPPGSYVAICGGVALILFVFLIDIIAGDEDEKAKKAKADAKESSEGQNAEEKPE